MSNNGYNQQCWNSFRSDSQRLDFAPCRATFLCSCWARPRCDKDAESLVHKGPAQAKVAWGCSNLENSSTVWSWRTHVFTNLYPSVESSPKMKKRNGDDANPFNLKSKSMRGLDTSSLIGWGWKQWSGFYEISIDPYQGRSQAANQWVPRLAFRPVRDRLSLRSFIKRQLRPVFLRSQTSTHGPKRGFGKNSTLPPLVVNLT